MKRSYIIFICLSDPFNKGLPIYSFCNVCQQDPDVKLGDETHKVIINAAGKREGLSQEMIDFLDYIQKKCANSSFTKELQKAVEDAITHRNWEVEYMTLNMKLMEERAEGRAEGRELEIFISVQEGDYGVERGAEKLQVSVPEFVQRMKDAGYQIPLLA